MVRCTTGQVVRFQYRKGNGNVSAAQYKGKIFRVIPTPRGRDIMVQTNTGLIRRFHANQIGGVKVVGIVERMFDYARGVHYNMPIV